MSRPKKLPLRRWQRPFRSEQDVTLQFPDCADRLLRLVDKLPIKLPDAANWLRSARKQHQDWAREPNQIDVNMFLAPGVQAATAIAEALVRTGEHDKAFSVSNDFAEMCKILIARKRDKYLSFFERLLWVACCACSDSWQGDGQAGSGPEADISALQRQMENVCRDALGTFFQTREGTFRPTNNPDTHLGKRVMGDALANLFDARLGYLLASDRPRVKEYVTTNLPFVYRILPKHWADRREGWERELADAGYEDVLQNLRDGGDLVSPDEVGQVNTRVREEVRRAQASNDFNRVYELLAESANELTTFLYTEAGRRLAYREPCEPKLREGKLCQDFGKCRQLARTGLPDKLRVALELATAIWQEDTSSLERRDWVAYLEAKTGNLPNAEDLLLHVHNRRDARQNFATDWNLAVLAYDRKDEKAAYQLLVPLLEREAGTDEDLVLVVLALALKLSDRECFLMTIPRIMNRRFYPLAIRVAHELKDEKREKEFLGDLLKQWQTKWELPPPEEPFSTTDDFDKIVSRAIVERQIAQLVYWLRARIQRVRTYVPNYLALARVLEEELQDINNAFAALRDRSEVVVRQRQPDQRRVNESFRDLLELCRRAKRNDLGQQAYRLAVDNGAGDDLLRGFRSWDPQRDEPAPPEAPTQPLPGPIVQPPLANPDLATRLAWANAQLADVKHVESYLKELRTVEDFVQVVAELHPQESATVVELIRSISAAIEAFAKTDIHHNDSRRLLYDKTEGFEKRLAQLVTGGAMTPHLKNVVTPYVKALERVVGDLSRQAGYGPKVEAVIENPFLSLEAEQTALALRLKNVSERPVTAVQVQVHAEGPLLSLEGEQQRRITRLGPQESCPLRVCSKSVRQLVWGDVPGTGSAGCVAPGGGKGDGGSDGSPRS